MKGKFVYGHGTTDLKTVDANGKRLKSYIVWADMLKRCYSQRFQSIRPSYVGITVCKDWLIYSKFKEFYDVNCIEGWELDKDLLQLKVKNKIYSPDTCLFIPRALNLFFSNQYSNNTSGYTGVSWNTQANRWEVRIRLYNHISKTSNNTRLGYYDAILDAANVYINARKVEAEKWRTVMKENFNWSDELICFIS